MRALKLTAHIRDTSTSYAKLGEEECEVSQILEKHQHDDEDMIKCTLCIKVKHHPDNSGNWSVCNVDQCMCKETSLEIAGKVLLLCYKMHSNTYFRDLGTTYQISATARRNIWTQLGYYLRNNPLSDFVSLNHQRPDV